MQTYCIACNSRFFYNEGDDDCTKFICSYCYSDDISKSLGKWVRLRFRILQRDQFTCKYCGNSPLKGNDCELHIDHIEPRHNVMCNSEKNLITACRQCNCGKLGFELSEGAKKRVKEYIEGNDTLRRLENGHNKTIKRKGN